MRVIIYCNRQNNQGNANFINQILQSTGTQRAKLVSVMNLNFVGYKKKYKILYDKYVSLSNLSGTNYACLKVRKKLSYVVNFNGSEGDSTDIIDNDIRILVISNGADIEYNWDCVVRYTDA